MPTIGILGGTNWSETARYYRLAREIVRERGAGGLPSRIMLDWVDDHELEYLQATGEWDAAAALLVERVSYLREAGAHGVVLCGSLVAEVSWRVMQAVAIPVVALHENASRGDVDAALLQVSLRIQNTEAADPSLLTGRRS